MMHEPVFAAWPATGEEYGFGPAVMMRIKVCSHCGQTAAAAQHFCIGCGRRLPAGTLYQRYCSAHRCCPVCDTVLPDMAAYCPQCGAPLPKQPPDQ